MTTKPNISYRVIRSQRKTIAIQINAAGEVVVRCSQRLPEYTIHAFVESKRSWIEAQLQKRASNPQLPVFTQAQLKTLAEQARRVLTDRVAYFAPKVGVTYGRITIRSQHSRWGSCSGKGNLNFNCLLMLTPPAVQDYVAVHELCHRKQMNHSAAFWAEVAKVMPDYALHRKWLKENGTALIRRLP